MVRVAGKGTGTIFIFIYYELCGIRDTGTDTVVSRYTCSVLPHTYPVPGTVYCIHYPVYTCNYTLHTCKITLDLWTHTHTTHIHHTSEASHDTWYMKMYTFICLIHVTDTGPWASLLNPHLHWKSPAHRHRRHRRRHWFFANQILLV